MDIQLVNYPDGYRVTTSRHRDMHISTLHAHTHDVISDKRPKHIRYHMYVSDIGC